MIGTIVLLVLLSVSFVTAQTCGPTYCDPYCCEPCRRNEVCMPTRSFNGPPGPCQCQLLQRPRTTFRRVLPDFLNPPSWFPHVRFPARGRHALPTRRNRITIRRRLLPQTGFTPRDSTDFAVIEDPFHRSQRPQRRHSRNQWTRSSSFSDRIIPGSPDIPNTSFQEQSDRSGNLVSGSSDFPRISQQDQGHSGDSTFRRNRNRGVPRMTDSSSPSRETTVLSDGVSVRYTETIPIYNFKDGADKAQSPSQDAVRGTEKSTDQFLSAGMDNSGNFGPTDNAGVLDSGRQTTTNGEAHLSGHIPFNPENYHDVNNLPYIDTQPYDMSPYVPSSPDPFAFEDIQGMISAGVGRESGGLFDPRSQLVHNTRGQPRRQIGLPPPKPAAGTEQSAAQTVPSTDSSTTNTITHGSKDMSAKDNSIQSNAMFRQGPMGFGPGPMPFGPGPMPFGPGPMPFGPGPMPVSPTVPKKKAVF